MVSMEANANKGNKSDIESRRYISPRQLSIRLTDLTQREPDYADADAGII